MPCTQELNRKQDKETLWKNAKAEAEGAERAANIAGAASGAACAFAVVSLGIGGAACAAALATLAHAMNQAAIARDKEDIAKEAYDEAQFDWLACVAKTFFINLVS